MKSFLKVSFALVVAMCLIGVMHAGYLAQTVPQSSRAVGQLAGVDPGFLSALEWRSVGPHRGGRSIAVVGDPNDPLVFYFGSTHGGVWKTEDAGTYWRNVSDGFFKTSPVGAIDVSLSNPAVVYVGMGESLTRQDISPGDGVYKSTDGGKTWTHVGLKETRHIAKVRIHPTNPDIVYVAAAGDIFGRNPERGVFRTRDGGKSWQRVLYKSEQAGAFDLSMDPTNPNVLYASLNQLQRLPWDQASGGPDSGLYKTSDGGETWTDITHRPGMPKGIVGKIGLAISPVRSSRVWALVESEDGGLYRSDDGGATWQAVNHSRNLWRSAPSYMHVVADQQNPDTVWVPAYDFLKSTDGGRTFASLPMPHGDHHALWIDPRNPKRMIEGSDGGATVTLNGGATWSTQHNQPTAELFGLAIDDQVPYRLYAAQNDNTHVSTPSRTDSGAIPWMDNERIPAGEGGETAVKPDGSVVYGADRAGIDRYDRRTGQAVTISVWPDDQFTFVPKDVKYRFYYTLPLLLSPHDSKVLYTAGNQVFRTTDEGNSWEAISKDLSRNRQDKLQKMPGGLLSTQWSSLYWVSLAQSLAESRLQKGELWVGMDDSTVQVTKDGGKTWENVSPKEMPEWTTVAAIEVSPHTRGTVYLAAHRYKVSDLTPYFYKTTDYGRTWQMMTSGIRSEDFARTIREDPVRPGLLYAGTDTGVYVSFDAGTTWQSLQRNLPAVSAQYMAVKNNDLVVATHGRGFWIMDNLTALRQITSEMTAAPAHLFEIAPTHRYLPVRVLSPRRPFRPGLEFANAGDTVVYEDRRGPDGRVKRFFLNAGENPPGGVVIDYYLKQPSGDATLTIVDGESHVIAQFSANAKDASWMPAERGTNRFVWDLRYPGAREIAAPAGFVGAEFGRAQPPAAPPGRYTAQLSVGGHDYRQSFEIKRDPRIAATDEDLRAQFDLLIRIRDRVSQVTDAVDRLRKARQQVETRTSANVRDATRIRERLTAIEGALTRLAGPSPMVLPPKALNNRLAALTGAVAQADARPTKAMYAVYEELSAGVAEQIRQLDELIRKDLSIVASVVSVGSGGADGLAAAHDRPLQAPALPKASEAGPEREAVAPAQDEPSFSDHNDYKHRWIDVDGVRTHYLEAGDGPTFILVHGALAWESSEVNYGDVIGPLSKHFHVIAGDMVGYGYTKPRGPQDYTAQAQGDFLIHFIDALHVGPVFLTGSSHGGFLTQYVAHQRPNMIKKLIITNSLNGTSANRPPMSEAEKAPLPSQTKEQIRNMLERYYKHKDLVTEERVRLVHDVYQRNYKYSTLRSQTVFTSVERYNQNLSYKGKHISEWGGQLEMPLLLVWSEPGSRIEWGLEHLARVPGSEMHILPWSGHHLFTDQSARWVQIVTDWLLSAPPRPPN